jgi:hypothetical protein
LSLAPACWAASSMMARNLCGIGGDMSSSSPKRLALGYCGPLGSRVRRQDGSDRLASQRTRWMLAGLEGVHGVLISEAMREAIQGTLRADSHRSLREFRHSKRQQHARTHQAVE